MQTPTCDRSTVPGALENLVSVTGDADSAPDVAVSTPLRAGSLQFADLETGEGTEVVTANQLIGFGITLVNGETGEQILQQGYDAQAQLNTVAQWDTALPGISDALMCASAGSRIVVAFSPEDLAEAAQVVQTDGASVVAVIDLQTVYLSAADGAEQFNQGLGLPAVVRTPDGVPGVIVPDAEAPTEPVAQVLKKGDGATVAAGDTIAAQVLVVGWDKQLVSTTWGDVPTALQPVDGDDPVLDTLVGQTVGSQVMVVVPASETQPTARVHVVDILGVVGVAAG